MDLTIIIPTYNRNQTLIECLLTLQHNEAEVIVVDDGSTEPVEVFENVRVLRHETNRGRAAAINTGLNEATHDLVLIMDDDIFAAPDMVVRLVDEFSIRKNPKLAIAGRLVWDPELPLTLTMQWLEKEGPYSGLFSSTSGILDDLWTGNTLLWRPFILDHGGFDENIAGHGLEDVELGLRLKQYGLEVQLLSSAIGYHHKCLRVRNLVHRKTEEGIGAVYLHSKFPHRLPQIDNIDVLLRNEALWQEAESAVDELAALEQNEPPTMPSRAPSLFMSVYRFHFMHGILEGLRDIGGLKPKKQTSFMLEIYNQASRLETIGEVDEARRLFTLVLNSTDDQYWAGAAYRLGCIESQLGNFDVAHAHLNECLKLNPGHRKARHLLRRPDSFNEVMPDVFERFDAGERTRVLFALFGGLGDIINAFPTVAALRSRFPSADLVWMTLPQYGSLARASLSDSVCEVKQPGVLPWDWIESEGFTHVFNPENDGCHEAWQESGLHRIEFLAHKCGIEIKGRRSQLEPDPEAFLEADLFLREHGLTRKAFLSASHVSVSSRHWPHSKLMRLSDLADMPVVVFGGPSDPELPGCIPCFGRSFHVVAALIQFSLFYIGPDSGVSWLATTTSTPMGIFMDPLRQKKFNVGFRDALRGEKDNIEEWGIHTHSQVVLQRIDRETRCLV